jgi:hypothetical protein
MHGLGSDPASESGAAPPDSKFGCPVCKLTSRPGTPRMNHGERERKAGYSASINSRAYSVSEVRFVPNLDQILVRQWPARKLSELAADGERS